MRVPAEIRVTRRDAGTRSHAGKNPQKPETRTPVTRNYPIPDFSTRNPSLVLLLSMGLYVLQLFGRLDVLLLLLSRWLNVLQLQLSRRLNVLQLS